MSLMIPGSFSFITVKVNCDQFFPRNKKSGNAGWCVNDVPADNGDF